MTAQDSVDSAPPIIQHSTAPIVRHSTAQRSTAQRGTAHMPQHSTSQHGMAQHSTAWHCTGQHSTAQHSTAQHSTAQHRTTQHSTRKKVIRAAAQTCGEVGTRAATAVLTSACPHSCFATLSFSAPCSTLLFFSTPATARRMAWSNSVCSTVPAMRSPHYPLMLQIQCMKHVLSCMGGHEKDREEGTGIHKQHAHTPQGRQSGEAKQHHISRWERRTRAAAAAAYVAATARTR